MPCEQMPNRIVISKETAEIIQNIVSAAAEVVEESIVFRKKLRLTKSWTELGVYIAPLFSWTNNLKKCLVVLDKHAEEIKRVKKNRRKACQCSHHHSTCKTAKKGRAKA